MRLNGKALQLHVVYKKLYYLLQLTRESVSVLKVTQESVILQVTCAASELAMKLKVRMIITILPSSTGKKYHSFVAVGIVTCAAHS